MDKKREKNRGLKVFAFFCCLFCSLIWFSPAEAEKEAVRFVGPKMSADIDEIYLRDVFQSINAQKGFWVKGDSSVIDSKISIRFKNLSFQDGLKRILGHINHIMLFDGNREPSGVIIVGGGESRRSLAGKRSGTKVSRDATSRNRSVVQGNTSDEIEGLSPGIDLTPPSKTELSSLAMVRDVTIPGGPVEVTEQDLDNFKLEMSLTPPGGVVKTTPEELEGIKPTIDDGMTP